MFIVEQFIVTEPQPETRLHMDIPRYQCGEDNVVKSGTVECFEFTEAKELLLFFNYTRRPIICVTPDTIPGFNKKKDYHL